MGWQLFIQGCMYWRALCLGKDKEEGEGAGVHSRLCLQ